MNHATNCPAPDRGSCTCGEFNHYVIPEALRVAEEYGNPVTALCGYTWFPTGFRPGLPLCPVCDHRAGITVP